jgi:ArsR family transcriptional regulator
LKPIPLQRSDEDMVRMFRALGHPARLSIVRILMERRQCVCGDLVEELPLAQATVSQHLKVLKEAGIVIGEVSGAATCYCLAPGALSALQGAVTELASNQVA